MSPSGKNSRFNRLNAALLYAAIAILLVMTSLAYLEWKQYTRARTIGMHTWAVQNAVEKLLSSMLDAETGERGFVLTGKAQYLEPYNRALAAVPGELATLNRLLAPPQAAPDPDVVPLNILVNRKLVELRENVDLRTKEGAAQATEMILSDRGRQYMDEIRNICSGLMSPTEAERTRISADALAATRGSLLVTAIGSMFLIGVLLAGHRAIQRVALARERALEEAQTARDSLQITLGSIGDAVISTDAGGRIVFANDVAKSLLKWTEGELVGQPIQEVFRIVNEYTRAPVESPVD
jgi:CHASE3 domain sensor protein